MRISINEEGKASLFCTDPDPEHVHDEGSCCECGSTEHCCGGCPVFVAPEPYKRVSS